MWRSGGEKGLRLSCAGKLGVPLERDWYVEELFELHQGCQVRFRISRGNVVFHLRRCSGKGPHLAMTGNLEVFLGFPSDSRVPTGKSESLSCWPGKSNLHLSCERELGVALESLQGK